MFFLILVSFLALTNPEDPTQTVPLQGYTSLEACMKKRDEFSHQYKDEIATDPQLRRFVCVEPRGI